MRFSMYLSSFHARFRSRTLETRSTKIFKKFSRVMPSGVDGADGSPSSPLLIPVSVGVSRSEVPPSDLGDQPVGVVRVDLASSEVNDAGRRLEEIRVGIELICTPLDDPASQAEDCVLPTDTQHRLSALRRLRPGLWGDRRADGQLVEMHALNDVLCVFHGHRRAVLSQFASACRTGTRSTRTVGSLAVLTR